MHILARILTKIAGNPFARRETHSVGEINTYKVLTLATWLLSAFTSVYYTLHAPHGHHKRAYHTIWQQNDRFATGFSMNWIIATVYW